MLSGQLVCNIPMLCIIEFFHGNAQGVLIYIPASGGDIYKFSNRVLTSGSEFHQLPFSI
jgi:hypothetical protein